MNCSVLFVHVQLYLNYIIKKYKRTQIQAKYCLLKLKMFCIKKNHAASEHEESCKMSAAQERVPYMHPISQRQ